MFFNSEILNLLTSKFIIGTLFFVRVSGVMASGPFLSHASINAQLKFFIAAIIAIIFATLYAEEQPQIDFHLWNLALLVIKEFLIGAIIGFSANLVFFAARFAGGMIDFDLGYHTALLFDAESSSPTLIGELKSMIALMIFLFLDGHHFLIEGLAASIKAIPLTHFQITDSTINLITKMAASVMIIAVKIAAPVLIAIFLTNLSLALLARIAPQTNIFILSFTMKVMVGILVLAGAVPLFVLVIKNSLSSLEGDLMNILISMNPVGT